MPFKLCDIGYSGAGIAFLDSVGIPEKGVLFFDGAPGDSLRRAEDSGFSFEPGLHRFLGLYSFQFSNRNGSVLKLLSGIVTIPMEEEGSSRVWKQRELQMGFKPETRLS